MTGLANTRLFSAMDHAATHLNNRGIPPARATRQDLEQATEYGLAQVHTPTDQMRHHVLGCLTGETIQATSAFAGSFATFYVPKN